MGKGLRKEEDAVKGGSSSLLLDLEKTGPKNTFSATARGIKKILIIIISDFFSNREHTKNLTKNTYTKKF